MSAVCYCKQGYNRFLFSPNKDENECEEGSPCSHSCHNAIGTYYCSCPRGLTISADGRTCQGTSCPHTTTYCSTHIEQFFCMLFCPILSVARNQVALLTFNISFIIHITIHYIFYNTSKLMLGFPITIILFPIPVL